MKMTRRIVCLLLMAMMSVSIAIAEDDVSPYAVSYTTYDTTYEKIVAMYIRVLNAYAAGKSDGHHDLFNPLIELDIDETSRQGSVNWVKTHIGFAVMDINNDGTDELLIGDGVQAYEIFTVDNGKVRELIRAGRRYSCHIMRDGTLRRFSYHGADLYSEEIWEMNGTSGTRFIDGYVFVCANPRYSSDGTYEFDHCIIHVTNSKQRSAAIALMEKPLDSDSAQRCISREQYDIWDANHQPVKWGFIPFAAYEKLGETGQIGIVHVDGKTSGNKTVNMRKKPEKGSRLVKKLKVGTYIAILETDGDYFKVSVDGKEGYIESRYVESYSFGFAFDE